MVSCGSTHLLASRSRNLAPESNFQAGQRRPWPHAPGASSRREIPEPQNLILTDPTDPPTALLPAAGRPEVRAADPRLRSLASDAGALGCHAGARRATSRARGSRPRAQAPACLRAGCGCAVRACPGHQRARRGRPAGPSAPAGRSGRGRTREARWRPCGRRGGGRMTGSRGRRQAGRRERARPSVRPSILGRESVCMASPTSLALVATVGSLWVIISGFAQELRCLISD